MCFLVALGLGEKGDVPRGGGPASRQIGCSCARGGPFPHALRCTAAHRAPLPSPAGVAAFTGAHLLYLWAFGLRPLRPGLLLLVAPALLLYTGVLLQHLPPDMAPALVTYSLVLASMLWRGLARGGSARWGALLFTLSDSVLAWDAFAQSLPHARLMVMTTYYAAQLLIALSAFQSPRPKSH